uniref:Dynein regulatory complex protein 1 n=1 Tax=Petromyzon marinus TaxID=7757 RepID=A0AAJ7U3Z2_PETMA|nr:dynein regulatory complex subunit 2 [Petromyzon marinus]
MPGKRKKFLTEEEQLLQAQQKLLAEEDSRRKKEDMLMQYLKEKLAKEENNTRLNSIKLTQQWRAMMRQAKSQELCRDLEILSQTFERVVDRKDSVIKCLTKDLEEAEEQHCMAFRSHMENVQRLLGLQAARVKRLREEYQLEVSALKEEFDSERELIVQQHAHEISDIKDILFAMEENFAEKEKEALQEFHSSMDEIKNDVLEEKQALRVQLEGAVEALWRQFQVALQQYTDATEERRIAFDALKTRDEKSAREIEAQARRLQRLQDSMASVRARTSALARECEERNQRLREERAAARLHALQGKGALGEQRSRERKRLAVLAEHSHRTNAVLNTVLRKAEQVLKMGEICRRMETEQEKVLPFPPSALTPEEQRDVDTQLAQTPTQQLSQVAARYSSMERFWCRYNKVLLEQLALEHERDALQRENGRLRRALQLYLEGLSLGGDAPALATATAATPIVPVGDARVRRPSYMVVIEAAHVVKHLVPS